MEDFVKACEEVGGVERFGRQPQPHNSFQFTPVLKILKAYSGIPEYQLYSSRVSRWRKFLL